MIQVETFSSPAIGSRLIRLPLVLLLAFGLLLSLIHCAGCELNFASAGAVTVTTDHQGSAPDAPEALPCHSGHCLSHVTAQLPVAVAVPADLLPRPHVLRQEQFSTALAGLPLFKPPRA